MERRATTTPAVRCRPISVWIVTPLVSSARVSKPGNSFASSSAAFAGACARAWRAWISSAAAPNSSALCCRKSRREDEGAAGEDVSSRMYLLHCVEEVAQEPTEYKRQKEGTRDKKRCGKKKSPEIKLLFRGLSEGTIGGSPSKPSDLLQTSEKTALTGTRTVRYGVNIREGLLPRQVPCMSQFTFIAISSFRFPRGSAFCRDCVNLCFTLLKLVNTVSLYIS